MRPRRVALAVPGALDTLTGGYLYDRRVALELEAAGWRVERLALPDGFPVPSAEERAETAARLARVAEGTTLLVDGLAFGALPELAATLAERLDLVALVHHPLCLETDLDAATAAVLETSETEALAHARAVIVTSPATAALLVQRHRVPAERVTVAVPGTDPAPVAAGSGGSPCRMICVGTVTPRKGHRLLVEALAGLGELPWTLDCVGSTTRDARAAAEIAAAVEALELGERVRLLGELPAERLAQLYHAADLLVSASLFEGYGMALSEALARGLPVVAARGGAVGETVPPEAGLLVEPGDVLALRQALRRFLSEPDLAAGLRRGALAARARLPRWADTGALVAAVLERR